jgi:predicted Zn-dependent protease
MKIPKRFLVYCLIFIFLGRTLSPALAISIPDEKKLSRKFMDMIKEQRVILHDPIARHMLNTVGNHILSALPSQPFNYTFYLIDDDTFNAFASPAANIFVHRGLIDALDTIDEFAGIIAHEIAHAASRHVSQSIDRSKLVGIGTMAGMLAGILVGSAGGGDAAQAMTIGSMAAGQSTMLAFTRENEIDADQKAVMFLKQGGYCPKGLLSGLTKMRESDFRGVENIPDYFKTHPGTSHRIAHIAGLLADYKPLDNKQPPPETFDFEMVKYRIAGLYGDLAQSFNKVKTKLRNEPENPALHYGMGLLYSRKNQRDLAISHLQKALSLNLFEPMILLELGRVYIHDGKLEKAIDLLQGVKENPIMGLLARYYMAIAQLETGNLVHAEKNLTQVIDQEAQGFPRAYYHMANIMSQEKNQTMFHYYLGVYYSETYDEKNTNHHLGRAMETLTDPKLKKDAEKRLKDALDLARKKKRQ